MKPLSSLALLGTVLGALLASSSSFAYDCRAIFEPGYSDEVKALLGDKFELVDEDRVENPAEIPFRIVISDDVDVDPEILTFRVSLNGQVILEEKRESGDFSENVEWAKSKLKTVPSCSELYRSHPAQF